MGIISTLIGLAIRSGNEAYTPCVWSGDEASYDVITTGGPEVANEEKKLAVQISCIRWLKRNSEDLKVQTAKRGALTLG